MRTSPIVAVITAACLFVGHLDAEEETAIAFDKLPAAVQATLTKEAGKAELTDIEQETEDGKLVYSAEAVIDGKTYEFTVAPDGTLLEKELEDDADDKEPGKAD